MDEDLAKPIVGIVALVIVAGALAYAFGQRSQFFGVDTDTVGYDRCGLGHEIDTSGRGRFADPASDARKMGEVFSTTRIWYGWFKDGESRPVTIQAKLVKCPGALLDNINNVAVLTYRFSYSDGGGWTGFAQDRIPSGAYQVRDISGGNVQVFLPAYEVIIDGFEFKPCDFGGGVTCAPGTEVRTITDGAALKVEVFAQRTANGAFFLMAEDQVELRSGLPETRWERQSYKVGDTACALWEVPTTAYENGPDNGTSPAYFMSLLDMNDAQPVGVWDRKPLETTTGRACIEVTADLFSKDLQTCANRLRAVIYSPIIVADQADTAIQDEVEIAANPPPTITDVSFDKPEYQEGDTITFSWRASGNVTKFHITVHIGGLLLVDTDVGPDVREHDAVASRAGVAEVEITPYNFCSPGNVRKEQVTVGNVFPGLCELFPDLPQCTGAAFAEILVAVLALVAVLVVFFLALWISAKVAEKSDFELTPLLAFLVALGAAAVVAFVLVGAGAFDGFLLLFALEVLR